jgi:hypothetical protein
MATTPLKTSLALLLCALAAMACAGGCGSREGGAPGKDNAARPAPPPRR